MRSITLLILSVTVATSVVAISPRDRDDNEASPGAAESHRKAGTTFEIKGVLEERQVQRTRAANHRLIPDPVLDGSATGRYTIRYDLETNRLRVEGRFEALSSPLKTIDLEDKKGNPPSAIHLHRTKSPKEMEEQRENGGAPDGDSGEILRNLTVDAGDDGRSGTFSGEFILDDPPGEELLLLNGAVYIDVHTEDHPTGELRGQPCPKFPYDPPMPGSGDADLADLARAFDEMPAEDILPTPNRTPVEPIPSPGSDDPNKNDMPYPPDHKLTDAMLDHRTAEERFLDPNRVEFDHPAVQPRPRRSRHLRVCVDLDPKDDPLPSRTPGVYAEADTAAAKDHQIERFLPEIVDPERIFVTYVKTAPGIFPQADPFRYPPGTNMLPTIYEEMRDRNGKVMPNTLPSRPNRPYNLHEEHPRASRLETESSPTDDLRYILDNIFEILTDTPPRRLWERLDQITLEELFQMVEDHEDKIAEHQDLLRHHCQWAIDIIEGNKGRDSEVPGNRAYRGFALLHHSGHERTKRVMPIFDDKGNVVSGNVNVHQVWYDGRIESDTMFYDFGWDDWKVGNDWYGIDEEGKIVRRPTPIPIDVPWTITYTVDVLNRGEDDFSPTTMYFDAPVKVEEEAAGDRATDSSLYASAEMAVQSPEGEVSHSRIKTFGPWHVSMDQTFFPMQEGTRTIFKIKMAPPQYFNLTYTWGWRKHPPRAQATENAHKRVPPNLLTELIAGNQVLKVDGSCPRLPAPLFSRLPIASHERFVFDGIRNPELEADRVLDAGIKEEASKASKASKEGDDPEQWRTEWRKTPQWKQLRHRMQCLAKLPFFRPTARPDDGDYNRENGPFSRLGDLAPAKRMWRAFRAALDVVEGDTDPDYEDCLAQILEARQAFLEWKDRNHLPGGLRPDPKSDLTMLFVNNTIYAEFPDGGLIDFAKWRDRSEGNDIKITLVNADHFPHGYLNVDFGGNRGWENVFKPTLPFGGQGSFFTFGRFHWRFNTEPGAIGIPPAIRVDQDGNDFVTPTEIGSPLSPLGVPRFDFDEEHTPRDLMKVKPFVHRIRIRFNFDPSRRLRFYQFDPLHHDVAIYSIH